MDKYIEQLELLDEGSFRHLNGSLITHLKGTESILKSWGGDQMLRTAGLFHAAYGTAGFDENIVALSQRKKIASIIGNQAEALVYLYCSCDRNYVLPKIGGSDQIRFKDRFNGALFTLSTEQANLFCELTVANELELVYASEKFKNTHGRELFECFEGMEIFLSFQAREAYKVALSKFA